jgi:hypothetical protein
VLDASTFFPALIFIVMALAATSHRAYKQFLRMRLEAVLTLLKNRKLRRILLTYFPLLDSTNEPWTQPLLEHYLVMAEWRIAAASTS